MKEIFLQWLWFTFLLAIFIFGLTALIFKVGDLIDKWRANRRKK